MIDELAGNQDAGHTNQMEVDYVNFSLGNEGVKELHTGPIRLPSKFARPEHLHPPIHYPSTIIGQMLQLPGSQWTVWQAWLDGAFRRCVHLSQLEEKLAR